MATRFGSVRLVRRLTGSFLTAQLAAFFDGPSELRRIVKQTLIRRACLRIVHHAHGHQPVKHHAHEIAGL
jgi:hypothetical protein